MMAGPRLGSGRLENRGLATAAGDTGGFTLTGKSGGRKLGARRHSQEGQQQQDTSQGQA